MKQRELFKELEAAAQGEVRPEAPELPPEERFSLRLTLDKIVFLALAGAILLIVVFSFGVEQGKKMQRSAWKIERTVESITNLARVIRVQKSLAPREDEDFGRSLNREIAAMETKPPAPAPAPAVSAPSPVSAGRKSAVPFSGLFSRLLGKPAREPAKPAPVSAETAVEKTAEPPAVTPEPKKTEEPVPVPQKGYEVRVMSVSNESYGKQEVERLAKLGLSGSMRKSGDYYLITLGVYGSRLEADKELKNARTKAAFKDAYIRRLT